MTLDDWKAAGRAALDARDPARALAILAQAGADGDRPEILALRVEALLALARWDESLTMTEVLLERTPDSAWAYRLRCVALDNLRRFEEEVECARAASRLDPQDANARYFLGQALWQMGRESEAVPEC